MSIPRASEFQYMLYLGEMLISLMLNHVVYVTASLQYPPVVEVVYC